MRSGASGFSFARAVAAFETRSFFRPSGLVLSGGDDLRLAPWAAVFRRSAAFAVVPLGADFAAQASAYECLPGAMRVAAGHLSAGHEATS